MTRIDVAAIIAEAKLGRARKEAQEDVCFVFAAALHDVLADRGIPSELVVATKMGLCAIPEWHHSLVKVGDRLYDSMGEFSEEIHRARAKIHPTVKTTIIFSRDDRANCHDDEFEEYREFFAKALKKAIVTNDAERNRNIGEKA
jgi:hypothetical protein